MLRLYQDESRSISENSTWGIRRKFEHSVFKNRYEILQSYETIIEVLTDTSKLDKESVKLESHGKVVAELLKKCVEENAYTALNQAEYEDRYNLLVERYEIIKNGIVEINDKLLERSAKREIIKEFILMLEQNNTIVSEFDEELWNAAIKMVKVNSEKEITLIFKDGLKLE